MQREIEELHNAIDAEQKAKANAEKAAQAVEIQVGFSLMVQPLMVIVDGQTPIVNRLH